MASEFPFTLPIFVSLMIGSALLEGGFCFPSVFFFLLTWPQRIEGGGRYLQKRCSREAGPGRIWVSVPVLVVLQVSLLDPGQVTSRL